MDGWGFLVISYPGHFVPFLVISYLFLFSFWSFRTQFGHFVPTLIFVFEIILDISYPIFTFSYPSHSVTRVISYPGNDLGTN